jgi:1-acyl-sn-glycerol-3-phosphate acyltransferase
MTSSARHVREARRVWRLARLITHVVAGVLVAHSVFVVLGIARLDRAGHRRASIVRWWMRRLLVIINVRVQLEGRIQAGPILYCANHISWLDIPCLRAIVDAAFVSKEEVRRWPVIGRLAAVAGTLFLKRGERDASAHTADHMTWSLAAHRPVIIFPEGTTTDGRELRRFHARLYQAAVRTDGHVQAVAIRYHRPGNTDEPHPRVPFLGEDALGGHLWTLLAEDAIAVRIHFCEPVHAAGQERRALADGTRGLILASLGLADDTPSAATVINTAAR